MTNGHRDLDYPLTGTWNILETSEIVQLNMNKITIIEFSQ